MAMIYLDNAATTYPKPESVYEQMDRANRSLAFNAGRGSYAPAREAASVIECLKNELLNMVNGAKTAEVVLSASATFALNQIIGGLEFAPQQYVYVSPYEHNAVIRTLYNQKIFSGNDDTAKRIIVMPLKADGSIDEDRLLYEFSVHPPAYVFMTHVSNVTGYILPIDRIASAAKEYGAVVTVDGSQALGLVPFDINELSIDFYVFAGHKTLCGPFGIAGFFMRRGIRLNTFIAGGTGSDSLNVYMPDSGSLRYEPASANVVAAAGLLAAVKELEDKGVEAVFTHEKELTEYMIDRLNVVSRVRLYLPPAQCHIGITAFNLEGYTASDVGLLLDEDYGIAVRTGYHCAPFIHDYLGDKKYAGVVRASVGRFTTREEIDAFACALKEIQEG